jgi:beta-glucosidase
VVAAWLPGSEGQGVADVLFGDYKAAGKLSFTWPKAVGQGTADPLFAYGYGL